MTAFGGINTLRAVYNRTYAFTAQHATVPTGRCWHVCDRLRTAQDLAGLVAALMQDTTLTVVAVVPPKPTTHWWQRYATLASEVHFLTGEIDRLACAVLVFYGASVAAGTRRPVTRYWDWRAAARRGTLK